MSDVRRRTLQLLLWPVSVFAGSAAILRGIYQALDHTSYRLIVESPRSAGWEQVESDCSTQSRYSALPRIRVSGHECYRRAA
ncbi:MAG: hypothetical protein ACUVSV_02045 [Armatimonadota bacterium]